MRNANKMRLFILLVILITFLILINKPQNQKVISNENSEGRVQLNGGGNPNTVAIFTAKVLQVGILNPTTEFIHKLAIFIFSMVTLGGAIYNGYNFYKWYKEKYISKKNTLNQEDDYPIEQSNSTSFNNE